MFSEKKSLVRMLVSILIGAVMIMQAQHVALAESEDADKIEDDEIVELTDGGGISKPARIEKSEVVTAKQDNTIDDEIEEQGSTIYSDEENKDSGGWSKWEEAKARVRAKSNATDEESKDKVEDGKRPRFVKIIEEENGFAYYLDMQNARWLPLPHSSSEQIIDIWVKLVQVGETEGVTSRGTRPDSSYSYTDVYYLEHYYLRPKKQQIQFLCELEVTGRPQNAIEERRYSAAHWEDLVPGSVEDEIYHAAVAEMKRSRNPMQMTRHGKRITARDAIEEYFRISL